MGQALTSFVPPADASRVASESPPPSGIPTTLLGARAEMIGGRVSSEAAVVMASTFAHAGKPLDTLGGVPGWWSIALAMPGVHNRQLAPDVVDWAVDVIAKSNRDITAAAGELTPTDLAEWSAKAEELDEQFALALALLITDHTAQLLRSTTLQILNTVKDADLREILDGLNIEDVPSFTHANGKRMWQIFDIDEEKMVEQLVVRFKRALQALLEQHQRAAAELWASIFGVDPSEDSPPDIQAAILVALARLRTAYRAGLEGRPWATAQGVARNVVDAIAGNEQASKTDGIAAPPSTWSDRDGWWAATVSAWRKTLADGGFLDGMALLIATEKAVMVRDKWWDHVTVGNPFEPHKALDKQLAATEEFGVLARTPISYERKDGTVTFTAPWTGTWYIGDHVGCQCRWRYKTYLRFP